MTMRLAAPLLVVLLAASCTSILGDDFFVDGGGSSAGGLSSGQGGSAGATTSSGGGGSAGQGGTSGQGGSGTGTSSGSAGSGGNAGGSGGGGGGVCSEATLGTTIGCGSGLKCSIVDTQQGTAGCVPAGPRLPWSLCTLDSQCVAGTWCDLRRQVCKPICGGALQCDPGGNCIDATNAGGDVVPTLQVCTADCEPVGVLPCNQSHGDVTCVRTADGLDCADSASGAYTSNCGVDAHCAPGLICESSCWTWCRVGTNDCGGGWWCAPLSPAVFDSDSVEYGVCVIS